MLNFIKTIISAIKTWARKEISNSSMELNRRISNSSADWNEHDPSKDSYVKNRTHYDARSFDKARNITFDCNLDGKEYLDIEGDGSVYVVKVSDLAPSIEEVTDGKLFTFVDGEVFEDAVLEDVITQLTDAVYQIFGGTVTVVLRDTFIDGSMVTKGVWFRYEPNSSWYHSRMFYNGAVGELKKLDFKYLPTNLATMDDIQESFDFAKNVLATAETAVTDAATAQSTADSKMDTTDPVGTGTFSMNRKPGAKVGNHSSTLGYDTIALGVCSHAEGDSTIASRGASHVEGSYNIADDTHELKEHTYRKNVKHNVLFNKSTEFYLAKAYEVSYDGTFTLKDPVLVSSDALAASFSNYKGYYAIFSYDNSNGGTAHHNIKPAVTSGKNICKLDSSIAVSHNMYNYRISSSTLRAWYSSDISKYAHIVGNGTSDTERSNAHTLDWNGVGWYQGGLQVGGNAQDDGARNVLLEGDAIPVPENASPEQILTVKSVDENGKPTEWECIEFASAGEVLELVSDIFGLHPVSVDDKYLIENNSYLVI